MRREPTPSPAGAVTRSVRDSASHCADLSGQLGRLARGARRRCEPAAFRFIGSPDVALLIAVLAALVSLGPCIQTSRHHGRNCCGSLTSESFEPIANVLMILAAAGGLSGILRDSGAAQATVSWRWARTCRPCCWRGCWLRWCGSRWARPRWPWPWLPAYSRRWSAISGVRPELLVLATGTGSLIFSQVNDPGFWMVQSFFKLEVKETFATWTVLETVLSIVGLAGTLLLASGAGVEWVSDQRQSLAQDRSGS